MIRTDKEDIEIFFRKTRLKIETLLSRKSVVLAGKVITISIFILIIIGPIFYLLLQIFLYWGEIYSKVFNDPILGNEAFLMMLRSIGLSLKVAGIVTFFDLIVGISIAWVLARYDFKGRKVLDTLVDMPMAVPTSALGFSIYLFWGTNNGISRLFNSNVGLVSQGTLLIILTHIAFTFPYVTRSIKGIIADLDLNIEKAAKTLGAPPFTIARMISLPMVKESLLAGTVLAFTRSLGETGATLIVSGVYQTAPVVIVSWMKGLKIPTTAFLSLILIVISLLLLTAVRLFARRVGLPWNKVFPRFERKLSSKKVSRTRDSLSITLFFVFVFIPALFVIIYLFQWWNKSPFSGDNEAGMIYQVFQAPDKKIDSIIHAFITSIEVALIVTIVNLIIATPMALLISKTKDDKLKGLLDTLIDIPLIIPSSALGFSIFFLWGSNGLHLLSPGFLMIIVSHISFTYAYCVRPLVGAFDAIPTMYDEAAFAFGSSKLTAFRTVTIPFLKSGLIAASIMTFTRSMSETGATIIVQGVERTIPVLLVDFFEASTFPAAAFAASLLILISFLSLLLLRYVSKER
ncbi:MAG: ABC transporter permease subunit [Candidatus Heimdallarchaeum endolithica]|uniref:ABC transporter permease subunit n=1 Tax=Candidatus Heimdallarchaeum endolithica TaxID=2876572 RepID=A0A9Y1BS80_9ARCH|nr:MAG: ABC transporter permease subunit [Candidatus Heimdallarchaeum endolithica]